MNGTQYNNCKYYVGDKSLREWCFQRNFSYTWVLEQYKKGVSIRTIEQKARQRYIKYKHNIDSYIAYFKPLYAKTTTIQEKDKIREEFFNLPFGENVLEKGWDSVTLLLKEVEVKGELWKVIEGSDGTYEVSNQGRFRRKAKIDGVDYLPLNPFEKQRRNKKGIVNRHTLHIKIKNDEGRLVERGAAKIVAEAFIDNPKGYDTTHIINGDYQDIRADNIKWVSRARHGELTGYSSRRSKPVLLLDDAGEIIEEYRSARAAAYDNFISYQTVLDYCHGKRKKPLLNFVFKEDYK